MELNDAAKHVLAKPTARRPGFNRTPPADTAVEAIKPMAVRLKPNCQLKLLEAEATGSAAAYSNATSNLIYKPVSTLVSKSTVPVLSNLESNSFDPPMNMSEFGECNDQLPDETYQTELSSEPERNRGQEYTEEENSLSLPSHVDRASSDGHSWRKYGQKRVKGSEYPRSYYKCTYPNCPIKKMVERTHDGQIAEVIFKGEHNHSSTLFNKCIASDGHELDATRNEQNNPIQNDQFADRIEGAMIGESQNPNALESSAQPLMDAATFNACVSTWNHASGECEESSEGVEAEAQNFSSKRRRCKNQTLKGGSEEKKATLNVVQNTAECEIVGDGFRWRKYGQKVVKGNPNPRSYYKCTSVKCNVRKYVEKSLEEPATFITTYEGRHNHELPSKTEVASTTKA